MSCQKQKQKQKKAPKNNSNNKNAICRVFTEQFQQMFTYFRTITWVKLQNVNLVDHFVL